MCAAAMCLQKNKIGGIIDRFETILFRTCACEKETTREAERDRESKQAGKQANERERQRQRECVREREEETET